MKIGQLIGDNLVEDGATLQMGIGSIPDAVLSALKGHKDLGIHSEMFSVGVIDLFRRGCVTNNKNDRVLSSYYLSPAFLLCLIVSRLFHMNLLITFVVLLIPLENLLIGQFWPKIFVVLIHEYSNQILCANMDESEGYFTRYENIKNCSKFFKNKPNVLSEIAEMLEIDYVNNTHIVSLQPTMTAINSCIERAYELIKIAHPDHREALEKAAFERLQCMPAP
ncbi:hypothetical protein MSG28_001433 [Choristoneura fumiferana]|uniref:Uncharacterized protein n=1 Tax=Choristoneura fumiferana TaxID=7141 RepID=A0ACC0KU38_CHOFU|nr:hypothetical protein MSG28_001433 [Choristoneura fumiferana]